MAFMKRVFLFLMVNMLIVVTISTVLSLLGVSPYLTAQGIDYQSLLTFCLVWGFGGALISLGLSRVMAKWMMSVKVISETDASPDARWLQATVARLASQAGLPGTPEVGVYDSDSPNAFATGPTKSRALVAVSTGLLRNMQKQELEGVLAHEVAHIANGDMVTMTLLQGVVNAFVMFFARVIGFAAGQLVDSEKRGLVRYVTVILFEVVFSLLGMMAVAAFSRYREYRADGGGADLVGRGKMIAALQSLQRTAEVPEGAPQSIAAFQISAGGRAGILALFSTHPPLAERIRKLQQN
ncbi:MAG: protease HtpX [Deltaproteobacteria bacterium]|nr:protease HtpX [Deltaproteobacteria bacterium]